MTYADAMADWQRRWDEAKRQPPGFSSFMERLDLMVELHERLRPDMWERNHGAKSPDNHLGAVDA